MTIILCYPIFIVKVSDNYNILNRLVDYDEYDCSFIRLVSFKIHKRLTKFIIDIS